MENVQGGDAFDCAVGVVGLAAASISLAGLTVASGGWAIFGAVIGFQAAAVGATRACRGVFVGQY